MTRDEAIKGIAYYRHEQAVLLRWIRMRKALGAHHFDRVMYVRPLFKGPLRVGQGDFGDAFMLGRLFDGVEHDRDWWLHLLQLMIFVGLVDARTVKKQVFYFLPKP